MTETWEFLPKDGHQPPTGNHGFLLPAIAYAKIGIPVFPIVPNDKNPLTPNGFKDATVDQARILAWWKDNPKANIGMPTGQVSGISVLDLDGQAGVDTVKTLGLPQTWTVQTPRGTGYHLYFRYTPELRQGVKVLPGIDTRNDGGYVLLPPSWVVGDGYEGSYVVRRKVLPFAALPVPPELRRDAPRGRLGQEFRVSRYRDPTWVETALGGVSESQRNDTATSLAGYFHRKGLTEGAIMAILRVFAANCRPPMDERELERTVASVQRYSVPGITNGDRPDERGLLL